MDLMNLTKTDAANGTSQLRTGIILFSHGSLLCGAGETLKWHAERLRATGEWVAVEVGYLNYSEPPFETAVERCAGAGVTHVVVVPYFLVSGKFVRVDLPKQVEAARSRWPHLTFTIAEAIGYDDLIADALLTLAASPKPSDAWRDDLRRAADFCEADPDCPLYGTAACPRVPGMPAETVTAAR